MRVRLCESVALTLATASMATANAPAQEPERQGLDARCRAALALGEAGETEVARKFYTAALKNAPGLACAAKGLAALNKPAASCAGADASFAAGNLAGARASYQQAGGECGTAGLAAVQAVEQLCAQGDRHKELHRDEDATSAYKAALEKNPKAKCAREGLEAESWLTRSAEWVTDTLPRLMTLLAAGALGFLLLLLLLARPRWTSRRLSRLPWLGKLFSPRLTIDTLDAGAVEPQVGAALVARIAERLQRYSLEAQASELPPDELDYGTAREEFADLMAADRGIGNAFGKVREASEQASLVAGLVDLVLALIPRHRLGVTGVLEPPTVRAGASFSLDGNGRVLATTSLSGPELDQPAVSSDYLELAEPAAVWIQYETARAINYRKVGPNEAESQACLRKGLAYQTQAERRRDLEAYRQARAAYEQAVELNPRNWAARVNLAVVTARLARDYRGSTEVLEYALKEIRREGNV